MLIFPSLTRYSMFRPCSHIPSNDTEQKMKGQRMYQGRRKGGCFGEQNYYPWTGPHGNKGSNKNKVFSVYSSYSISSTKGMDSSFAATVKDHVISWQQPPVSTMEQPPIAPQIAQHLPFTSAPWTCTFHTLLKPAGEPDVLKSYHILFRHFTAELLTGWLILLCWGLEQSNCVYAESPAVLQFEAGVTVISLDSRKCFPPQNRMNSYQDNYPATPPSIAPI